MSTSMHVPCPAPQPIMARAAQDWFSKAVETVSDFFKQNPNEQESYSAAKKTAEEMQGVHRRRAQLGVLALPLPSSIRSAPTLLCTRWYIWHLAHSSTPETRRQTHAHK